MSLLSIKNLHAGINEKEILKGLDLELGRGEVHIIMGPNGAGKSTLAAALMNNPKYKVTEGVIEFDGEVINGLPVDERAKRGIFLSFQYAEEVPGVSVENFIKTAYAAQDKKLSTKAFRELIAQRAGMLNMDLGYTKRYLNVGFSGGEKKKNEILQMLMLEPKLAILDETDSGLDVDAIKSVSEGINELRGINKELSLLVITHHDKFVEYLKPDFVHILVDGRIIKTGGPELAEQINDFGFTEFKAGADEVYQI